MINRLNNTISTILLGCALGGMGFCGYWISRLNDVFAPPFSLLFIFMLCGCLISISWQANGEQNESCKSKRY
jgi:hypothetical protein